MLNLSYSLLICTLLQGLLFAIAGRQAGLSVGGGMRVENSDIKVGSFKLTTSEAIGSDIKTCTILGIGGGTCEKLPGDWLKTRLDADITTHFG